MTLSPEEEKKLQEAFFLVDRIGNGIISENDAILVLRCLGLFISDEEILNKSDEYDINKLRQVYIEFLKCKKTPYDLKAALDEIFKDNDGHFNMEELKHGLSSLCDNLTKKDIEHILQELEINTSGEVDIDDFVASIFENKL